MTTTPAKLLGIESRAGAIKAGMLADIIAIGESLDNPQALKQVNFVMKGGKVIVSKGGPYGFCNRRRNHHRSAGD
jgi:imidazolonepropionase-like amidohydrolase